MRTQLHITAPATDDLSEARMTARLVHTWERAEMLPATESPTLRNQAIAIFNRFPAALRIYLARNGYTLFLVIETGSGFFDISGRALEVTTVEVRAA